MDNRLDSSIEIQNLIERLGQFHPKKMDLDLARSIRLAQDLDNPHLKIPPAIHIAGTNGKGSTLAFLKACLQQLGLNAHAMTSPHLVEFRERFELVGQIVSNEELLEAAEFVIAKNRGLDATFFELITLLGFHLFSKNAADYTLLETGMGGRLDATNIVPNPALTLITMISNDHAQHLGNTLAKIAAEKAGIMKRNVPCILGYQTDTAKGAGVMDVFEKRAAELNVKLYRAGHEWAVKPLQNKGFLFEWNGESRFEIECPAPSLLGAHQIQNAGNAIAGLVVLLGAEKAKKAIEGVQNASWKARLQRLNGKILDGLKAEDEVWLDGGHNDSAGQVLAQQLKEWEKADGMKTHVILGMLNTKTPEEFVAPLRGFAASIHCISIPDQYLSYSAVELAGLTGGIAASSLEAALQQIAQKNLEQNKGQKTRILITGSLYLAGYVLGFDKKGIS